MFARMKALAAQREARAFAVSFAPTLVALLLQLGTFVILGRALGATQFGQISAALALAAVLVEVAGLGSGDILVRAVVQKPGTFSRYWGSALWLGGLSLPVAAVVGWFVARDLLGIRISPLPLAALMLVETAGARVAATVENVAVAHRDVLRASTVRFLTAALRFGLAVVVFGVMKVRDVDTWIWWTTGQSLIAVAFFLTLCTRAYGNPSNVVVREDVGTGLLFAINQTARATQGNFDRVFMATVATGAVIGAYAAGSRIVQLGLFPVQILNRLLYPRFFAKGHEGGLTATRRFAVQVAPAAAAVGAAGGLAIAGAALLAPRLLGPSFAATTPITMALACALPLIALQYPPSDALTGSGKQAMRTAFYTASTIAFSLGLALGAAAGGLWGVVTAFILGNLFLALMLWGLIFILKDAPSAAL